MGFKMKFIHPIVVALSRKMTPGWKDIMFVEAGESGPHKNLGLKLVPAEDSRSSITSQQS